jgi:sirohydrochlorin cobaltochelatase
MSFELDDEAFAAFELRLKTLLPVQYQERYEDVRPVSMGSAGLKFGADGRVAWDEIWGSFCDLAMAGGPPHRGRLLEAASEAEIVAEPYRYAQVIAEICRGISLVSGLVAEESPAAGWVRVTCESHVMAEWLVRAITMENVAVRTGEGRTIDLPMGPGFRLEKEIKNVVTVVAKTCHFWTEHVPAAQRRVMAEWLAGMEREMPLLKPSGGEIGWRGMECGSARAAVWMMRMLVASNVLSRREGTVCFVPVDAVRDPDGTMVRERVERLQEIGRRRGVLDGAEVLQAESPR